MNAVELAIEDDLTVPDDCTGVPMIAAPWIGHATIFGDGDLLIEHSRTDATCGEPLGKDTSWHTIEIPAEDVALGIGLVLDALDDQLQLVCGCDVVDEAGEFPIPRGVVVLERVDAERGQGCARGLAGDFGCPSDFAFDVPMCP